MYGLGVVLAGSQTWMLYHRRMGLISRFVMSSRSSNCGGASKVSGATLMGGACG